MTGQVMAVGLGDVADELGGQLRDRRLRLGMSVRDLATEAHVDRGRLAALEAGEHVRDTTLAKVRSALDRLEEEIGMELDDRDGNGREVEFRVRGNFGVDVVVRGPVEDIAALEASVARLVGKMQQENGDPPSTSVNP